MKKDLSPKQRDELLAALHAAGSTWAVFGWPVDVHALVAAARAASEADVESHQGSGG